MKKKAVIAGILIIILLTVIIAVIALRGRMTASTMRINEIEGTVILTDENGNEQIPAVGRRLQDGSLLDTKEESKAAVELDDDRLVYMLELSRARFGKSGKDLKLTLETGSAFFYIAEKLKEDESFEISASTMVIGIRGTSGYVMSGENGSESVTITSGSVSVYCGKTDETYDVHAGQKMSVIQRDGEWIVEIVDTGARSLPAEVRDIITGDNDLLEEVLDATGWAEDDLNADAGLRVAVPETVVDGVLHHEYYELDPNHYISGFLDPIIEACDKGSDSVIALNEQYSDGTYDKDLIMGAECYLADSFRNTPDYGMWCRFIYDDYRICLKLEYDPESAAEVGVLYKVYIIPENGMGYYVSCLYIVSDDSTNVTFGSCPCADGMFEGEMTLRQHIYKLNSPDNFTSDYEWSGTVKNGLVNGSFKSVLYNTYDNMPEDGPIYEYVDAEFADGVFVSGTRTFGGTDLYEELAYFPYGYENSYLIFGGYDDVYFISGSNECYPY